VNFDKKNINLATKLIGQKAVIFDLILNDKTMAAYVIFTREKTLDQNEMEAYIKAAPAGFVGHTVKVLATHTEFEVIEGPAVESVVLLEFPTMDAAKAWYYSPEYKKALEHRLKGGVYRCAIVKGV